MTLDPIDRLIDREAGELCWHLMPNLKPECAAAYRDESYSAIWRREDDDELRRVAATDPVVPYPALLLYSDRTLDSLSGMIFPPRYAAPLRLSEYLSRLRRFLILQFTIGEDATAEIIMRAVRDYAQSASPLEVVELLDTLWRGRWIVGSHDWGFLRLSALAGGTEEGIAALLADQEKLQAEAVKVIQIERQLKEQATCLEDWLHGIYGMLPMVFSVLIALRRSNEDIPSDEIEKFDRILDEFQADIGTTLHMAVNESDIFHSYIEMPLSKEDLESAVRQIRGLTRGRTIIPRAWYDAVDAAKRAKDAAAPAVDPPAQALIQRLRQQLSPPDCLSAFGRAMSMDRDPWMTFLQFECQDR